MPRRPDGPPPPPAVQRVRIRYAKRGRLRFSSHRDFQRALERALRRAEIPMAYSAGFTPHPKVSYANAAPTGAASEAEYVELGVATRVEPAWLRRALNDALPPGLDVVDAVEAGPGALSERLEGAVWEIALPTVPPQEADDAASALLGRRSVEVERLTKSGRRTVDVLTAVVRLEVLDPTTAQAPLTLGCLETDPTCAILRLVVRHTTPAVRPDDILTALRAVADLAPASPPMVTRLAQGPLDEETATVADPLAADRDAVESTGNRDPAGDAGRVG